ncbi:hypothetical protein [Rhodococcoides fascians]|uniref:hypothetical protein n=1 Tax=Rhodococcoides fascians TaxID=1828 RepID=UPI001DC43E8D|nr:hypothetical protein [Rhodococcus fascians]CAH0190785.1 hypothetical protein SRABI91_01668 [Rhodococcus fascians]
MSRRQDDDWQEDIYGTGGYNHSKNYPWRRGVKMSVDNPELETREPRDWDAYFIWNTTHLLRTLKLTHHLTAIQEKVVEEHCRLRAATVREDIESQYITRAQASKDIAETRQVSMGDFHELLMGYGKVCEEEGCLSPRAVGIRMDFASYYNHVQLAALSTNKPESQ